MTHIPVCEREAIEELVVKPGQFYIDCTFGGGGHTRRILERGGRVLALDADEEAIQRAHQVFQKEMESGHFIIRHANFGNLDMAFHEAREDMSLTPATRETLHLPVSGILLDLGFSSFQIETPDRGFAFKTDGPLDMRLDRTRQRLTAAQIVLFWEEHLLEGIIRLYGEERFAGRISRAIVNSRTQPDGPPDTTTKLARLIERCTPRRGRDAIHPATLTFQALRIAVNRELETLEQGLEAAATLLTPGGRLCVITFHSLEDRIAKWYFRHHPFIKDVYKKVITPGQDEINHNPRSRSAKLRVAERINPVLR